MWWRRRRRGEEGTLGGVDVFWTLLNWVSLTCSGLCWERKFMLRGSRHYADIAI